MSKPITIGKDSTTRESVFLSASGRDKHVYVLGLTGTGKTTLLLNMVLQDIQHGEGVCVFDPHGDFTNDILDRIPPEREADVILWEPFDTARPFGLNFFACSDITDSNLVDLISSEVMGTFYKLFHDSWGARMENLLRATTLTLIYNQDLPEGLRPTMAEIPALFTDGVYRTLIAERVPDQQVRDFWANTYDAFRPYDQLEHHLSSLNKVQRFLLNKTIRNIVGQEESSFNLRAALDEGKILLFNLAKGKLGEDNGALLGSILVGKILIAILSRADQGRTARVPFHLYVDEFHNYATSSFETLLAEIRKFGGDVTAAHQFRDQLEDRKIRASAVSVGSKIFFQVNSHDGAELASNFDTTPPPADLVPQPIMEPVYETYVDEEATSPEIEATKAAIAQAQRTLLPLQNELDKLQKEQKKLKIERKLIFLVFDVRADALLEKQETEEELILCVSRSLNPDHYDQEVKDYVKALLYKAYGQLKQEGRQSYTLPPELPSSAERTLEGILAAPEGYCSSPYEYAWPDDVQYMTRLAATYLEQLRAVFLPLKKAARYWFNPNRSEFGWNVKPGESPIGAYQWEVTLFPKVYEWVKRKAASLRLGDDRIPDLQSKIGNLQEQIQKDKETLQQLQTRKRYLYDRPVKETFVIRSDLDLPGGNAQKYRWVPGHQKSPDQVAQEIANDLTNLSQYTARCKLNQDGHPAEYTIKTLAPSKLPDGAEERADRIRQRSRQTYGRNRATVEQDVAERVSRTKRYLGPQLLTPGGGEQPPKHPPAPQQGADDHDQPIKPRRKTP